MNMNSVKQSLKDVLEQQVSCTEQLLQTLAAERKALARHDVAAVELTTDDKLQCCQLLEQLDKQRELIVSELGFPTDATGTNQCLESLDGTDDLGKLWRQILDNIAACKTSNLVNGGLLEFGRQEVEQTLGLLRGQTGTPGLYTPQGLTSSNLGHRKLGEV